MEKIFYFQEHMFLDSSLKIEEINHMLRDVIVADAQIAKNNGNISYNDLLPLFKSPKFEKVFNEFFAYKKLEFHNFRFSKNGDNILMDDLKAFELRTFFKGLYILHKLLNETQDTTFSTFIIIDELRIENEDEYINEKTMLTKYYNDILDFALSRNIPNRMVIVGKKERLVKFLNV